MPGPPRTHVIATELGLGLDHAIVGGQVGMVLRVTAPGLAQLDYLRSTDLIGGSAGGWHKPLYFDGPASQLVLPEVPTPETEMVWGPGGPLYFRKTSGAGLGEYTVAGDTITLGTGAALESGQRAVVTWWSAAQPTGVWHKPEVPAGARPGQSFTLSYTPDADTVQVWLQGAMQFLHVGGGTAPIGTYTISGNALVMGSVVEVGDAFVATGWT